MNTDEADTLYHDGYRIDVELSDGQRVQFLATATCVNHPTRYGFGTTKQEAVSDVKRRLDDLKKVGS